MNENISLELLTVIDTIIKNGMLIKFSGYTSLLIAKNFLSGFKGIIWYFRIFFFIPAPIFLKFLQHMLNW